MANNLPNKMREFLVFLRFGKRHAPFARCGPLLAVNIFKLIALRGGTSANALIANALRNPPFRLAKQAVLSCEIGRSRA